MINREEKVKKIAIDVYDAYIELTKCYNDLIHTTDLKKITELIGCIVAYQKVFNENGIGLAREVLNGDYRNP